MCAPKIIPFTDLFSRKSVYFKESVYCFGLHGDEDLVGGAENVTSTLDILSSAFDRRSVVSSVS